MNLVWVIALSACEAEQQATLARAVTRTANERFLSPLVSHRMTNHNARRLWPQHIAPSNGMTLCLHTAAMLAVRRSLFTCSHHVELARYLETVTSTASRRSRSLRYGRTGYSKSADEGYRLPSFRKRGGRSHYGVQWHASALWHLAWQASSEVDGNSFPHQSVDASHSAALRRRF